MNNSTIYKWSFFAQLLLTLAAVGIAAWDFASNGVSATSLSVYGFLVVLMGFGTFRDWQRWGEYAVLERPDPMIREAIGRPFPKRNVLATTIYETQDEAFDATIAAAVQGRIAIANELPDGNWEVKELE